MPRVRLDVATAVLAVSSVIGALALVGIFIVYLVDHNSNDSKQSNSSTTSSVTTPTQPSGTTPNTSGSSASTPAGSKSGTKTSAPSNGGAAGLPGAKSTPSATVTLNKIRPDQAYSSYTSNKAGFSMLYPKGWVTSKVGTQVAGWVHNQAGIHIWEQKGGLPSVNGVKTDLLKTLGPQGKLGPGPVSFARVGGRRMITARFTNQAPGQLKIVTYRYVVGKSNAHLLMDFSSPAGVDNRRAYRKIAASLRF